MRRQAIILLAIIWLMQGIATTDRGWARAATDETVARVATPASPGGPALVSNVTIEKHDTGETLVNVSISQRVDYRIHTLPDPARLVVDIDAAQVASPRVRYPADTVVLKAVRLGQFRSQDPSIVRVVADLNGNPAFDVHATASGLCIDLHPREVAKSVPLAAKPPTPEVKPTVPAIVKPGATAPSTVAVPRAPALIPATAESGHPSVPSPSLAAPSGNGVKPDIQSTLPVLASSTQAAAPLSPPAAVTPEALRAERAAQTLTLGKLDSPSAAQGAPPATPVGPSEVSKPEYTGEPISLNLKDVDLKDFFRLIHEISGLNIIIDPNVSGTVTMVLDSVPWDQALDIVLKDNGLGKVLEGNVLRIARLQTLTSEEEGQTRLATARMDAAPLVTVFQHINYAKASDIAVLLKTWAGGGALSHRGTVLVDTRGNMLIISDVQSQIPIIMNVVSKIDRKSKQVSIEARVVLANADFTRTLSSALSGSLANASGSTLGGGATGSNSSATPTNSIPNAKPPLSSLIIPQNASTGFGAIAITNASSRYVINSVITAQEERDQAKTISRPTIVTQNNIQGMVQQGVQVPIQTTINNTISVQYYNATLQLTVTPQVTDDNNIFLIIQVRNDSVGASISGVGPEINTQQANTQVLVPDGGTVVFGGITVTSRNKSATYVPLLGNIPVLGHLFKTSNTTDQDQELLFFVSPTVLVT